MKLPKFSKKLVAIGAAAGIAMGAAGIAAAYLSASGTGSGTAATGTSHALTVTVSPVAGKSVLATGGTLVVPVTVTNNAKYNEAYGPQTPSISWNTATCAAGSFSITRTAGAPGSLAAAGTQLAKTGGSGTYNAVVTFNTNPTLAQTGCENLMLTVGLSVAS